MNILSVGIPEHEVNLLSQLNLSIEQVMPNEFELMDWLEDGLYAGLLINLDSGFGTMICREARMAGIKTPVIGVASPANYDESWSDTRTSFLENGGDDLLQMPFNPRELVASLRSVIQRVVGITTNVLEFNDTDLRIKLDQSTNEVFVNDVPVHFTRREAQILSMFLSMPGKTITKQYILDYVYNDMDTPEIKIVDVFVHKVRAKLKKVHPNINRNLQTVWGEGYTLRRSAPVEDVRLQLTA